MGRVHKKKIAQYNKENGDGALDTSTNGDEKSSDRSRADSDAEESIASSKKRTPKSTPVPDEKVDDDEEEQIDDIDRSEEKKEDSAVEDDKSEEEAEPESKNTPVGKKTAQKRKAGPRSKADADDGDDDAENDAEANGASPAKKSSNKKNAGKKAKAKPKSKKSKPETEDEADQDDEEGEEEQEYEVKDIIDHKTEKGVSYFLIRWKGYGASDDTWEEEGTLSCQDLIDKFNKKKKETKSPKAKPASKKSAAGAKKGGKKASEDPEKQWEVDKIIDYSDEKKGRVFRIRWKGYSAKFDTWEPEENLNCDDLIEKFTKKIDSQKDISYKELREEPKKTKRMVSEGYLKAEKGARKSKRAGGKRIQYADSD